MLKVFNSCRHSSTMNNVSENKLFTVLLNRRAMLGIALLLSTLLPLNQAAPMAKSSSYSNGSQIETTSIPTPSAAAKVETQLNSTIPEEKINDKVVLSPVGIDDAAAAVAAALSSSHIEKMLLKERKKSTIEYNHNSDSMKTTTLAPARSSNNYLDANNHSVSPINISPASASQAPVTASIDKNINADDMAESTSTSPTSRNEDSVSTTTTFILHSRSENANKNPTQETIFTAESSAQTTKPSPISTDFTTTTVKSSSDNTPSLPTSSLTEIDGLLPNINAKEHLNGGQTSVQSEVSNPLSTEQSIQTNDSDKNRGGGAAATATVANENQKPFEIASETDLGQSGAAQTPILIKSASATDITTTTDAAAIDATATASNNNLGGKITKVFDEEKSSSKKATHESLSNNNKKYNNKNNKDKSKKKANEEGGVYDPNGKLNDNLSMGVISTTQEPAISFGSDIGSAGVHATTIRSMESHFIDGDSFDKNKADISTFDGIHTESVINADVTNSAPSASIDGNSHIPTPLNGIHSVNTAAVPSTTESSTRTENTQVESTIQKHIIMDEKPTLSTTFQPEAAETKDSISEITSLNEKQLLTEKPEVDGSNDSNGHSNGGINEMNKSDNELTRTNNDIKTTIKPTPEIPSILDYDKSSEEIFDIVHETSTASKAGGSSVAQKRPHDSENDEFFLPADDLDTDTTATTSSAAATATTTTTIAETTTTLQSTIPINTESSIVRPNTGGLDPTITVPIPIVTSDSKQHQQTTDLDKASTISRDSDTIFYISNTEVKVVESSVPTPNTKQENRQFFPALFQEDIIVDFPGKNSSAWNTGLDGPGDKYEEDIILSPMKSNFDPTKLNDENLSISYVGESFIDIKEATSDDTSAGSDANAQNNDISSESRENARPFGDNAISSNVIIEPVVIPDVQQSIGVPIIAELPSQINIRDLDYKNSAIQLNNSGNSISSHFPTHPGDNLQKARELSAELPKTDSEEVTALLDDDKIDTGKNETQKSNTTAEAITNITAFSSVLDEDPEASK